jgi:rRNA maturation protein Nop10
MSESQQFLKSDGKDEMYTEWFICPDCGSRNIFAGANYCPECGKDVRSLMPV